MQGNAACCERLALEARVEHYVLAHPLDRSHKQHLSSRTYDNNCRTSRTP